MEREGYFERAKCVEEAEVSLWSGAAVVEVRFNFFSGGAFSWFSLQRHLIRDLWFSDPLFPFWSCLLGLFVVVLAAAFSVCLVSFFLSLIFRLPSSIIVLSIVLDTSFHLHSVVLLFAVAFS